MPTTPPEEAQTVPLRVQVIDLEPRVVDLVVPTYLAAEDLTQRMARDLGLGAWWEDGTRRTFWLRARGRLLLGHERLADLGVVAYELVHLLPQPRPGSPVRERPVGEVAEPMPTHWTSRVGRGAVALLVSGLWLAAVQVGLDVHVMLWPAFTLAWWSSATVHVDREAARSVRFALRGGALTALLSLPAMVAAWSVAPGFGLHLVALGGMALGVGVAHLAWIGPTEPAPRPDASERDLEPVATVGTCSLCATPVATDVVAACPYGCPRVFHDGCLRARQAVATGSGCEVCGARVR